MLFSLMPSSLFHAKKKRAQNNSPATHQILAAAAIAAETYMGKYKLSVRMRAASLAPNPPGVKKTKKTAIQART